MNKWISDIKPKIIYQLLGCLIIVICGIILVHQLQYVMDITFLDESNYLNRGVNYFKRMSKEWAPLYSGWYRFLYFFVWDTFNLFYINFKIISVLPFVLFFLVLTRYGYPLVISLVVSVFFMATSFNLPNNPKVSHFTIMLIFAVLAFMPQSISLFRRLLTMVFLAILLAYARPEMYLSALIFAGIIVVLKFTKKIETSPMDRKLIGVFVVATLFFHFIWGIPLGAKIKGQSRSLIAFGEHFSYNYSQWNNIDQYLWLKQDVIIEENFGEVKSLKEAVKANPDLFFRHLSDNTHRFFASLKTVFIETFGFYNTNNEHVKLIFCILFFLAMISSRFWYRHESRRIKMPAENHFLLLVLFVFMAPSLISSFLIFPREHYIILQIPFYLTLMLWLLVPTIDLKSTFSFKGFFLIVFIGALLILMMPKSKDYVFFTIRKQDKVLNNQVALTLLNNLEVKDTVKLLNFEGDFSYIIGRNYRWMKPNEKRDTAFIEFVSKHSPEIIYCTETAFKNPWYDDDSSWHQFIANPEKYNYQPVSLGQNLEEYFLFRNDFYERSKGKILINPKPFSQVKR